MRRAMIAATATSVLLALAACATPPTPPPGRSDQSFALFEAEVQRALEFDALQNAKGVDQPPLPPIEFVSAAEWPERMQECVEESGADIYFQYLPQTGPLGYSAIDYPDAEIADYLCRAQYRTESRGVAALSPEQAGYLYDYFGGYLLPCLRGQGAVVQGEIPTRDEFLAQPDWSPYFGIDPGDAVIRDYDGQLAELRGLMQRCPAYPAGLPMSGLYLPGLEPEGGG